MIENYIKNAQKLKLPNQLNNYEIQFHFLKLFKCSLKIKT